MEFLTLLVALLVGTVVLVGVAERAGLPYPILMLLFAALVAFVPGIPEIHVQPELILPLFLPPLLFAAAQRSSWSTFRMRWRTLLLLAVALVVVTAVAVAGTAWAVVGTMSVPAALMLGALVSPPDPVAVEAVAGKVGMRRRLVTTLQTEGLFNDAMAIVLFQAALAATLAGGDVGAGELVLRFVVGSAGAALLGYVVAAVVAWVAAAVPSLVAHSAATLVAPYAVYLAAEEAHLSGVVAVVVTALEIARRARPQDSEERLTRRAFWDVVELLTTGVAFGLVGMEMRYIIADEGREILRYVPGVTAVCVVVVAVRLLWMLGMHAVARRENGPLMAPTTLKEVLVLTWCGMRGLATLALALALPNTLDDGSAFDDRNFVVTCAAAVLLVTLVLPGLTLPALMRRLDLPRGEGEERRAERALATRAQRAALATLRDRGASESLTVEQRRVLGRRLSGLERVLDADADDVDELRRSTRETRSALQAVEKVALEAARTEILRARNEVGTDPEVVDHLLRRLDLRTVLLDH
jgi:CPA1 family monovalent cation:H+ antiporter